MTGAQLQDRMTAGTWLDQVRTLAWELDRELELVSSRRTTLGFALRRARRAGATLGQLSQASGLSRARVGQITKEDDR